MSIQSIRPTPTYANSAVTKSQKSDNQSATFKTFQVNEKPATPANNLVAASSSILTNNTSNKNRYTGAEFDQVTAILQDHDLTDISLNEAQILRNKLIKTDIFKNGELVLFPPLPVPFNSNLKRITINPDVKYDALSLLYSQAYSPTSVYQYESDSINSKELFKFLNAANFTAGHKDISFANASLSTKEILNAVKNAKEKYIASSSLYAVTSVEDDKEENKTQLKPTISKPHVPAPAAP